MVDFVHIHQVLTDAGYPESHNSEWFIGISDYVSRRPLIITHYYDCHTKERARIAVKSLLNKTKVYEVVVFSPHHAPIAFHGYKFSASHEREWDHYLERG